MMNFKLAGNNNDICIIESDEIIITDEQSVLDLMATVQYEKDCDKMIVYKTSVDEKFFDLKTKTAGNILQKVINYRKKLAVVGDFSHYTSSSLKDFIRESNRGNSIFFTGSTEEALEKLENA